MDWLEEKHEQFKNDPEYLQEYIKLLEDEIRILKGGGSRGHHKRNRAEGDDRK